MIGLEKSFRMMYSNIGLTFCWTLPLSIMFHLLINYRHRSKVSLIVTEFTPPRTRGQGQHGAKAKIARARETPHPTTNHVAERGRRGGEGYANNC